jgi:hypothetical protein
MGFFDFITKPIESLLTPKGTNARRNQEAEQADVAEFYRSLLDQVRPLIEGDLAQSAELAPRRRAMIRSLLMSAGSNNSKARIQQLANQQYSLALQQAAMAGDRSNSPGYAASARRSALNKAGQVVSRESARANSIEGQQQETMAALQRLGIGLQSPYLGTANQAASGIYGRPGVMIDSSGQQLLGAAIGAASGGGTDWGRLRPPSGGGASSQQGYDPYGIGGGNYL